MLFRSALGVLGALGVLAAAALSYRRLAKLPFDLRAEPLVLTWALVGSILGARLFTVPAHLGDSIVYALTGRQILQPYTWQSLILHQQEKSNGIRTKFRGTWQDRC